MAMTFEKISELMEEIDRLHAEIEEQTYILNEVLKERDALEVQIVVLSVETEKLRDQLSKNLLQNA